jgi:hypothetical protein
MPKSRGRKTHPRSPSERPAQPVRPAPPVRPGLRASRWRKRIGWPLCAVGGVLFLLGNIGARTSIAFLPFDPHHVFEQFGGGLIGILGLLWATEK